jgi:hypothetical protein
VILTVLLAAAASTAMRPVADPLTLGESSSERVALQRLIAPGAPPLLAFRYFDGKDRHRFGQLDLVLDDAGH